MESGNGIEYMPTYEDKDGDWMLVGDVPWKYVILFQTFILVFTTIHIYACTCMFHFLKLRMVSGCFCRMFVESCKRIRLMISSEAIGLGSWFSIIYLLCSKSIRWFWFSDILIIMVQVRDLVQNVRVPPRRIYISLIIMISTYKVWWNMYPWCFCIL